MRQKTYLSLILACYNEGQHLKESFKKIYKVIKRINKPVELIFVDDKSKDNTVSIIKKILSEYKSKGISFRFIKHMNNWGRGKTVMDGIRKASGHIVGFLDVDLEIRPEYILKALDLFPRVDVVVGRRSFDFKLSTIHRYISSKTYVWIVHRVLPIKIHDSEAGFKFFLRSKVISLLNQVKNHGWFWDTEIIAISYLMDLKIKEIPVNYIRNLEKTSTVHTLRDSFIYLRDLLRFYLRLKKGGLKT